MGVDYEQYATRPQFHGAFEYPDIFFRALQGASGTYADVGAGDGSLLRGALDVGALRAFSTIRAFDISQERVARIRRFVPEAVSEVADAARIPLPDESVDFYYSDQVIEHVPDDTSMAHEIYRVLKPGGRGLIGSVVKGKGAWYFYRCNGEWRLDPTHVREYGSLEEYAQVFRSAGLDVVDSSLEQARYPVTDLVMRGLLLLRLIKPNDSLDAYLRYAPLRRLARLKIPIPRYYTCYAIIEKAAV